MTPVSVSLPQAYRLLNHGPVVPVSSAHQGRRNVMAAADIAAALPQGCVAWLGCRVIPEPHIRQRYGLFIGEAVAAWADGRVFADSRWNFAGNDDLRAALYCRSFFRDRQADIMHGTPTPKPSTGS